MEDEGSSSNRGKQAAPPKAMEAIATSSTSSSSSESGKISGLDWSASSRESGSTSSTSSSDENSNSGGGSYVEIMLSDTDAGKRDADVEEGEIGEDADASVEEATEGSGGNLTGVKADLRDLAKARTCYIGRSLMHCGWKAALSPEPVGYLGRKPRRSPERMRAWSFGISLPRGFDCQCTRSLLISWRLTMFRSTS
jgi:hypothetical protein